MKMLLNIMYVFLGLALLAPPAMAQDTARVTHHELSVKQAVDYATTNNVQVKNALLDVKTQEQTNREVTGSAYPQINLSGSLTYNYKLPISLIPAEAFGGPAGTFQKIPFGVKWGATGGVSLSQILFDGQVFTGLKARKTLIAFQDKKVEVTEEVIKANVHKIYYQLVVSKTQIELLDANIERLNKLMSDTKVMYDNGFSEKLDVDKLVVQIANLKTEKETVLNQVNNGYLGLKVLLGMPVSDELILTDTLSDEQVKSGVLAAADVDYSQRKEFQYADLGIKLNEFDVERYKMSKIPTLSLNGYYNKNAQRGTFNFFNNGDWFNISAFTLDLKIPIFHGFSNNARIAKAQIALRQSQNSRDALKLDIDNEVQTARNNYNQAISSLDNQKQNMALAAKVYDQTKKKYEIGTGSQTEINTAQTDLKSAQTNYINSLYDAIVAKIDFLKATGTL